MHLILALGEAAAGSSPSLRSAWAAEQVPEQQAKGKLTVAWELRTYWSKESSQ